VKPTGDKATSIPREVREHVVKAVERFNRKELGSGECYYQARFRAGYCYLARIDFGRESPICRLRYNGGKGRWKFAIFKWSTESYDPDEGLFPGAGYLDGTVKGAMRAGMEAYPA
jgi:hypothetical protein